MSLSRRQLDKGANISRTLHEIPPQRSQAIAALAATGVIFLLVLRMLAPVNGLFYDAAIRLDKGPQARDVVLVGVAQREDPAQTDWTALVANLTASGAVAVAFTEPVAVRAAAIPVFSTGAPAAVADGAKADPTVAALAPAVYGIHRNQALVFERSGEQLLSLEAAVSGVGPGTPFYVRFDGGFEGIPLVALADVVAGRVPSELITGRIAVIDLAAPGSVGLTTPVTPDAPVMSAARFHAFAIQTLLSGRAVRDLGLPVAAGLVATSAFIGAAAYSRVRPRRAVAVVVGVTLAILAAGFAALRWGNTLLPVAELLLIQAVLSLFVWQRRESAQDEALEALRATLEAQVKAIGTSTATGDVGHAEKLLGLEASLLVQITPAGQLVDMPDGFDGLGLAEGGKLLIRAAIDEDAPVREKTADGLVWAVPLSVAGRLRGLWIARPTQAAGQHPTFARLLAEVADEVAQFLPASTDESTAHGSEVADSVAALRARMAVLEEVLGLASAGLGVYTPLGKEVFATAGMRQLLSDAGASTEPDAVELAAALCGLPEPRVAEALRFVIAEQSAITLPLASSADEYCVLRALWLASLGGHTGGHLLLQVVDLTDAARAEEAIRTMGTQLDLLVRNDLEAVSLAAKLLERADLPIIYRTRALERMGAAIQRAKTRFDATAPFMIPRASLDANALCPVDLRTVLARALVGARRTGLQVELDVPRTAAAVIAPPKRLSALVGAIVRHLGGGIPAGPVAIAVAEGIETTTVEFFGIASGLPLARLAEFLDGTRQPDSTDLRLIAAICSEIKGWGGQLMVRDEAAGRVGFVLTLRKLA